MKAQAMLLTLALAATAVSCGPNIPIVGLDENNEPTVVYADGLKTSEQLNQFVAQSRNSVTDALKGGTQNIPGEGFQLHTVLIGLGFSAQAGIGPIGFSFDPKIRFAFSDKLTPTLP